VPTPYLSSLLQLAVDNLRQRANTLLTSPSTSNESKVVVNSSTATRLGGNRKFEKVLKDHAAAVDSNRTTLLSAGGIEKFHAERSEDVRMKQDTATTLLDVNDGQLDGKMKKTRESLRMSKFEFTGFHWRRGDKCDGIGNDGTFAERRCRGDLVVIDACASMVGGGR
jgi:hypothetical protein